MKEPNQIMPNNVWSTIASSSSNYVNNDSAKDQGDKGKKERTVGTVRFHYTVRSMFDSVNRGGNFDHVLSNGNTTKASNRFYRRNAQDNLLLLALPHHQEVLPSNVLLKNFDLPFHCIKGRMEPVAGTIW
jgi:hypothetical protein